MRAPCVALVALVMAGPAEAGLTERDLAEVRIAPPGDARLPTSLAFQDAAGRATTLGAALDGRPALLVPVDYTCRNVCGPTLAIVAGALGGTGLEVGRDYRLIVVGIDPKDSRDDARALVEARLADPALGRAATILTGDGSSVEALTAALGYKAAYDPDSDQFAHPSAAVTLTADGRVARVLSGLALDPQDLRLALLEAGEGRIGSLGDRLALLCYSFDPVHGIYTPAIRRILQAAGAVTAATLALVLIALHRRSGRPRRPREGLS